MADAETVPVEALLDLCMDVIQNDETEARSIFAILKVLRRIITISPIFGIP